MPVEQFDPDTSASLNEGRPLFQSMLRGLSGKCPNCGEGELFARYLKTHDTCRHCGETLHHHRADDLPAYLNIFIVGHVVIGLMVLIMKFDLMGMWTTMFVTMAACVLTSFYLMRPLKGMVVGSQWALGMHGFGGDET